MAETKAKEYKRETVERKLAELMNRVEKLNEETEHKEFAYTVQNLVVFGSYINTNKDKVHDLDIGIELKLKPRYKVGGAAQARKEAAERAPQNADMILRAYWAQEEVFRYLKNKSGVYSFHPLNMEEERKIILAGQHKYIVDNGEIVVN